MNHHFARYAPLAAALIAAPAIGENTWFFEVEYSDPEGVINSMDDTARVTLWAAFDEKWYAFAAGGMDVAAADARHAGVWSYITRELKGPGTRDGTAVDGTVSDILVGQLHFPSAGIFADDSDPIAAWSALWSTEDLHARTVPLSTITNRFDLYITEAGDSKGFLDSLIEGNGVINVVPAPAAFVLVPLTLAARRRR